MWVYPITIFPNIANAPQELLFIYYWGKEQSSPPTDLKGEQLERKCFYFRLFLSTKLSNKFIVLYHTKDNP